jgi:hypothetical protein
VRETTAVISTRTRTDGEEREVVVYTGSMNCNEMRDLEGGTYVRPDTINRDTREGHSPCALSRDEISGQV